MQEQTLNEPKSLGLEFEVKKNTKNANRIGFSNTIFAVGERVYVLSAKQQDDLIKQLNEFQNNIQKSFNVEKMGNIETNPEKLSQEIDNFLQELKQEEIDNYIAETKTYDVVLRVKPEKASQIHSKEIDGKKCIVIPMEENENATINGVNTNI